MPEKKVHPTGEAKVLSMGELIKSPTPNVGGNGKNEIHKIELGKFEDVEWARIKWIDNEVARLQEQLIMHQHHRNLIVEKSAAGWGVMLEPQKKYEIATNQTLVEIREVPTDGASNSNTANRPN